jgi:apolipoprotein N-acyltransferase
MANDMRRKTNSEDAMKRSTLIVWLMGLGTALWLSSRVVDMHPTFAVAVVLAALVFSAFAAARPYRN